MRQAMQDDIDGEMSHISDMLDHARMSVTTLRSACMVLIALRACSLSEALSSHQINPQKNIFNQL
jgi:hypothetical protein